MERGKLDSQIPMDGNNVVPLPGVAEEINTKANPGRLYDSEHPSVISQNDEFTHPIVQTSADTLSRITGAEIRDLKQDAHEGYARAIEQLGPKAIENELGIKVGTMFLKAASQLIENMKIEELAATSEPPAWPNEKIEEELDLHHVMDQLDPMQQDILETYAHGDGTPESRLRSLSIKHRISTRAVKRHYNEACTTVASYMGAPTENVHYLPLNDISDEHPDSE